ncbi:hypothetical protein HHI36_019760 [Cryptolaemus montrouzieri]|uniref:Uncharacterized protein n=1 Tax=Cryptolaemus montrouzieri TaxID=559131 RepID=A0ABD2N8C5_9CUCU
MIRKMMFSYIVLFSIILYVHADFEVPDATLEVLRPKGFRVSIPDVEGIKLFAFHGKLNEEMNGREGGTFSRDITKAKNGRWTFYDPVTELKVGDTLYYWTYVDYYDGRNKLGYPKDDQVFQVTENHIVQGPGSPSRPRPTPTPTPTSKFTPTTEPSYTCEQSSTLYNGGIRTCKGQTIFSEDFNGLDYTKWTVERRFGERPDYEFVIYTNQPEVLKVADGNLIIKPTLSENIFGKNFVTSKREYDIGPRCTGKLGTNECVQFADGAVIKPPVASAQISTKNSFSFLYGKIEVKAKMPEGDWIYPELFLNPKNSEYGDYYSSGQIRIAFIPGNSVFSKVLYGGCILGASNGGRSHGMRSIRRVNGWSRTFNRYTVEWSDEKITLSVNDNIYGHISPPPGGFAALESSLKLEGCDRWNNSPELMAPFDKEMFITVGVGVGGFNFPDRTDGLKPWNNNEPLAQKNFNRAKDKWISTWSKRSTLEVQHIKVFAL